MSTPTAPVLPSGKLAANYFTSVRERGMLNTMLEQPAKAFEAANPGMRCRWTYAPPNGDVTLVTAYESVGYKVVDHGELPGTESSKTTGPVRCGDLVLQAAPAEVHEMILAEDARRAQEDLALPVTTYRDNLESNKVRRKDGVEDLARPIGTIRRTEELVQPKSLPEGGE